MIRGLRGFFRELSRTGSSRALFLQLRTGVAHYLRRTLRRDARDPIALFLENYGADGVRLADPEHSRLRLDASACLVCGLCSLECARVGGRPLLEPRDAVVSASRLEIDVRRLALAPPVASACTGCGACDAVCPAHIPIQRVQLALAAQAGA